MSHSSNSGHGVADIYKGVISDVIAQVKEAFLDENVDIDILNQLRKEWEEKVNQSGCVEMEPRQVPGTMRTVQQASQAQARLQAQPNTVRIQPSTQQIIESQQQHHLQHPPPQVQRVFMPGHIQTLQGIPIQNALQVGHVTSGSFHPTLRQIPATAVQTAPQYQLLNAQMGMPNVMVLTGGGQGIPVSHTLLQPRVQLPTQQDPSQMMGESVHQMDGNADEEETVEEEKTEKQKGKKGKMGKKEAEALCNALIKMMQVDGGGGMSDSSSEDEEADEDDDPLRRIADRIGDSSVADGDDQTITEEDPLNSEDDQTDDEDLETLFDADNVVMCQFEKVHRARRKWKFNLKDGIMHINGRDFCFQKCSGEAEW